MGALSSDPSILVDVREQQRAWNTTQQVYPREQCAPQLVAGQAAAIPEAVASGGGGSGADVPRAGSMRQPAGPLRARPRPARPRPARPRPGARGPLRNVLDPELDREMIKLVLTAGGVYGE